MPNLYCRICRRRLKNPLSVRLGIGPVCRARHSLQGELDFMRAEIQVLRHEPGKFIYVLDVGHNVGRTVTNDAAYIVELLFSKYGITEETRIFYKDSVGRIDEIIHSGRKFRDFNFGHEGVDLGEGT